MNIMVIKRYVSYVFGDGDWDSCIMWFSLYVEFVSWLRRLIGMMNWIFWVVVGIILL